MGFRLNAVFGSAIEWELKQAILSAALERWPFVRLPRRDFLLPANAQFAPPELTDYLFTDEVQYEKAVELNGDVEDGVPEWSRAFPDVTFAFVSVDCFGGTCLYGGYVVRGGETLVRVEAAPAGHRELLAHVGMNLHGDDFVPFGRGYFAHARG